jgi:hypothetical protein
MNRGLLCKRADYHCIPGLSGTLYRFEIDTPQVIMWYKVVARYVTGGNQDQSRVYAVCVGLRINLG